MTTATCASAYSAFDVDRFVLLKYQVVQRWRVVAFYRHYRVVDSKIIESRCSECGRAVAYSPNVAALRIAEMAHDARLHRRLHIYPGEREQMSGPVDPGGLSLRGY